MAHFPASRGNRKLGKDTLIINMSSATDCPSRKLNLCQLQDPNRCYALKAERAYPRVLPYRRRQEKLWRNLTAGEIADSLILRVKRSRKKIRYLRFSEAGDFKGQNDVDKMFEIADALKPYGITVYGYTARSDLDFSNAPENMVVAGSAFMIHNQFNATYNPQGECICRGNCRVCDLCKSKKYIRIQCKMH